MTAERLIRLMQHPDQLDLIPYEELKTLVLAYPYSHHLRQILLLKSQQIQHHELERNLSAAAAHSLDRGLLFKRVVPSRIRQQVEVLELKPIETVLRTLEAIAPVERVAVQQEELVVPTSTPPKQVIDNQPVEESDFVETTTKERNTMFFVGLGTLLFVPIFKTVTHLPPYMGMMLGLGIVWVVGEILHSKKDEEDRKPFTASHALSKIDSSSILFFLGILLAIGCLESTGLLQGLAVNMNDAIGNQDLIILLIGLASAVVDNVPLVAATMGMYDLSSFPTDHRIWDFLAYCAGTGGSILIIGSAAGVAVMGMEKIDFLWYLKRISLLALLGYFAGAGIYLLF